MHVHAKTMIAHQCVHKAYEQCRAEFILDCFDSFECACTRGTACAFTHLAQHTPLHISLRATIHATFLIGEAVLTASKPPLPRCMTSKSSRSAESLDLRLQFRVQRSWDCGALSRTAGGAPAPTCNRPTSFTAPAGRPPATGFNAEPGGHRNFRQ